VHEVSSHLHPSYVKHEICQLTDYKYDMSIPTFCNYSVIALLIKLLRCIVRYSTPIREI
jgi:hypothetical protein